MTSTTDPTLRSFVPVSPTSHFPIQNLPYGVFRARSGGEPRVGVAIGQEVVDLSVLDKAGLLDSTAVKGKNVFARSSLNEFMSLGRNAWRETRETISHLLQADVTTLRDDVKLRDEALRPMEAVEMLMPVEIGDYTDFYSSREHATNVGSMIRGPENALQPNWLHMPVAYHGRASSVIVSGTNIYRPRGQRMADRTTPAFGASRAVDFELEVGALIGTGNPLGEPIPAGRAFDHVFGFVLVNDWSARDIQKWEYQPLGPFLSKSFATSMSPWVVTLDALTPFRVNGPAQDPPPLAYLRSPPQATFDLRLEAHLRAGASARPERICATNYRFLYWNICQQIAHHTVAGCNLRPGDLLASGTISGPTSDSLGCLLELTNGGQSPLELPSGEVRRFLEDGDCVSLTGWCQGDGYRVGFGEVAGTLLPAKPLT